MGLKFNTGDNRRDQILFDIAQMNFKSLQSNCVSRGMAFEKAVSMTAPNMSDWLLLHWDDKKDKSNLVKFDKTMDLILKEKGIKKKNPLRTYKKFEDEYRETEEKKEKVVKLIKEKKAPREKNEFGIFKGTKKDYVYKLSASILTQFGKKYKNNSKLLTNKFSSQLFNKVEERFPGANEKSVRIWMKRAIDKLNETPKD